MARAQTSSAAISGHVVDKSNGAVAGAKVTLINELTNVRVETKVRQDGDFIFPDVQPGTFTVVIDAPGYKELRKVNLVLSASQNLSAGTMTLDVGQVSEQVTVSADVTPIQTTSAERSEVLDNKQMENLLAVGRDAMALTRTMPGVVVSGGSGGYGSSSLGTEATPTVNGVNSEYNSATIDGVTGNTRGLSTLDTPLNLDAIQQITILVGELSGAVWQDRGIEHQHRDEERNVAVPRHGVRVLPQRGPERKFVVQQLHRSAARALSLQHAWRHHRRSHLLAWKIRQPQKQALLLRLS